MAIDLAYPFALIILGGVAFTKTEFFPHALGLVVLLLALNSMRSSLTSNDDELQADGTIRATETT